MRAETSRLIGHHAPNFVSRNLYRCPFALVLVLVLEINSLMLDAESAKSRSLGIGCSLFTPIALAFRIWCFSGAWILDAWSFLLPSPHGTASALNNF